jgi:hypothetical protein
MVKRRTLAVIAGTALCAGGFAPGTSAGPPGPGRCVVPGSVIAPFAVSGGNPDQGFQAKFGTSPGQLIAYTCTPAETP